MKTMLKTLLAGFLCLTLPVWGAYAAVPDFNPVFNSTASFTPTDQVGDGGLTLSDLKFIEHEPEILSPEFLDSLMGLSATEEKEVLQNLEEQLQDELYETQTGKPFWLQGKILVIGGVVILLSGLAVLIGVLAGAGGGSGSGTGTGGSGGVQSLLSSEGPDDGTGSGDGGNENTNNNNPGPNDGTNNPENGGGDGDGGTGTPPGGGAGGGGGNEGGLPGDGGGNGNRSFPPGVPNNPEPGTMMLMLLGFCFPLLRKRFS